MRLGSIEPLVRTCCSGRWSPPGICWVHKSLRRFWLREVPESLGTVTTPLMNGMLPEGQVLIRSSLSVRRETFASAVRRSCGVYEFALGWCRVLVSGELGRSSSLGRSRQILCTWVLSIRGRIPNKSVSQESILTWKRVSQVRESTSMCESKKIEVKRKKRQIPNFKKCYT